LFNASIFIYHTAAFSLFNYFSSFMTSYLWYFHNFIEGSSKLLIAYAFWKLSNETNLQDSKT
jgi:hypothetical protein